MSYQVIALDLDGTLLTSEKTILSETKLALRKAQEAGFEIIIATGRHHSAIHPIINELKLTTPTICCNGTYLYDHQNHQVVAGDPLKKSDALNIITLLQQHKIEALLYAGDAMYYSHPTRHVVRTETWGKKFPIAQRPVFRQIDDLASIICGDEPLWKFAITHNDLSALQQFADEACATTAVTCDWSWQDQIDVGPQGNSKGRRLKEWVESRGISMQQVVAFGDNYNDISMLRSAGLGVAMAEAESMVQAQANIVIGSNETPSIAEFIQLKLL